MQAIKMLPSAFVATYAFNHLDLCWNIHKMPNTLIFLSWFVTDVLKLPAKFIHIPKCDQDLMLISSTLFLGWCSVNKAFQDWKCLGNVEPSCWNCIWNWNLQKQLHSIHCEMLVHSADNLWLEVLITYHCTV